MAVGLLYTGCGGGGGGDSIPGGSVNIVGRLIDGETRKPICRTSTDCTAAGVSVADVRVGIRVGSEFKECEIADENKTSTSTEGHLDNLFNEAGYFNCEVALATVYDLRVMATGYATAGWRIAPTTFDASATGDTAAKIQDIGNLNLFASVSVTVNVVDATSGAAVTGTTVYATPVGPTADGTDPAGIIGATAPDALALGGIEIACIDGNTTAVPPEIVADDSATADGTCILSGLNALLDYDFVVPPQDTSDPADGVYDYVTALFNWDDGAQGGGATSGSPTTITIPLTPTGIDDTPAIIATNCTQDPGVVYTGFPACIIDQNEAVRLVFNYPIADPVSGDFQLTLNGDATFVIAGIFDAAGGATALDFNGDDAVTAAADVAITTAVSAGNTVLTITPTAALTVGAMYTLEGIIHAETPGLYNQGAGADFVTVDYGTAVGTPGEEIFVVSSTDTTIADPTLDNYNTDDDGAAAVAVAIEFTEPVSGEVTVLATTAAGAAEVPTQNPAPEVIDGSTGVLINASVGNAVVGAAGAGCPGVTDASCTAATDSEAIIFADTIAAIGALADATAGAANSARIWVDVQDAKGNSLRKELNISIE